MASQDARGQYIEQYAEAAKEQMRTTGIPASITLAQAIIESGNGQSYLSKTANNHFGIKAGVGWTGDFVIANDDKKGEHFRSYSSVEESYTDHSRFLQVNPRYSALFNLASDDYEGWARGLQSAGYATNDKYASTLIDIVRQYGLDKYDKQVMEEMARNGMELHPTRSANTPSATLIGLPSTANQPTKSTGMNLPVGEYSMPLHRDGNNLRITSDFGETDGTWHKTSHRGLDLRASYEGIYATENNGKVVGVGYDNGGGNFVKVEYNREDGSKDVMSYLHLSRIDVENGDNVSAGQQLGISGNSGSHTSGAHLDFRIVHYYTDENGEDKSKWVDPKAYLAEINAKGNLQTTMRNAQGVEVFSDYKPGGIDDNPKLAQNESMQQVKYTDKTMSVEDWISQNLMDESNDNVSLGGQGLIGGLFSLLFHLLMLKSLFDNSQTMQEKNANITQAVQDKTFDLTSFNPQQKQTLLLLDNKDKPILQIDTGNGVLRRELSAAEQARISQVLSNSNLTPAQKGQSLGNLLLGITYSMQASQNYEMIQGQQQQQQQTINR